MENPEVAGLFNEVELIEARLVFLLSPDVTEFVVDLFLEKRPIVIEKWGLYSSPSYRYPRIFESDDVPLKGSSGGAFRLVRVRDRPV